MIKKTSVLHSLTKPVPLPKGLIYNPQNTNVYRLISLKNKKIVGEMIAQPIENDQILYKNKKREDLIFYIDSLKIESKERRNGWGKFFIDFAKKESFKQNCKGRISLVAYNYTESPHAFYKKLGFVTKDEKTNQILDEYVKNHWTPFQWCAMPMYLPEKNIGKEINIETRPKPRNIFEKIWETMREILYFDYM